MRNERLRPSSTDAAARVPVEELIDPARFGSAGRAPTPRELRAALPRGWVLDEDGRHARRDLRLLFREGWVLALGLVSFGLAALFLFWSALPRGLSGALRFVALLGVLLVAGGIVAPIVTRAIYRRPRGE